MNINHRKIKFLNHTMEYLDIDQILDCEITGIYDKINNFIEKKTGEIIYYIDEVYETKENKSGLIVSNLCNTNDWNLTLSIFNYTEKLFNKKFGIGLELKSKIKPKYEIVDIVRYNKIYKTIWYFIDGEIELLIIPEDSKSISVKLIHKHHYNFELAYNKFYHGK